MRSATGPDELRAQHRAAEEAEEGGGRDQQALPEAGEGEDERQADEDEVDDGHGATRATVIVPTWSSCTWKVHSKGYSPGAVDLELDGHLLAGGEQVDLRADRPRGPRPGVKRKLCTICSPTLITVSRTGAGRDGEGVGQEDVVVLGLQGDLLDAVGRGGHLADAGPRLRRRRGRGPRRRTRTAGRPPTAAPERGPRAPASCAHRSRNRTRRGPVGTALGDHRGGRVVGTAAGTSSLLDRRRRRHRCRAASRRARRPAAGGGRRGRPTAAPARPRSSTRRAAPAVKPQTTMSATAKAGPT